MRAFERFNLSSSVHNPKVEIEEYKSSIDLLNESESLDYETKTNARVEQSFLRNYLFENKRISKCSICNQNYPVEFLVAAHIKKRSLCSREERLDYKNIVTPMCKFGCDDLYERGYIYVDDGIITKNKSKLWTEPLELYMKDIVGNYIEEYTEGNKQYFDYNKLITLGK